MLLTLDIGNTNITIGCYEGKRLSFVSRMATDRSRMEDQYAIELRDILDIYGLRAEDVTGTIIGSVVPPVTTYITKAIKKITGLEPLVVDSKTVSDLNVLLNPPEALGADLIAGCVAALELYDGPCIIWDMGTATTVSVIDSQGSMRGGCIIPGVGISMEALTTRTAQLPAISMEAPERVIGTNTVDCMRSGLIYGQACMIDGMCDRIEEELGVRCKVIATGGLAREIVAYCKRDIIYSCNLLLEGLRILYEKNK
ncbi:type III pantothenate kinase [Clostridium minihomine]|uniref:type III pantothenate kinase n=1 Tax=Clostridium minihomine TaxID=2045012 RepID=UPI000C76206D|nr:type III pantothenate kinase [Clostridium minihomine]